MHTTVKRGDRHTQEVAALLAVQHPNLVRLVDVRSRPDGADLVLERATGGSLHELLAVRQRLCTGEAITVGLAVASALAELHRRGLVHGDVHAGNILFADAMTMTPLLADLGASAPIGHNAVGHGVAGRTAPEVERGAPPSPASDQWSLAAVLRAALGPVMPTPLAVVLALALAPAPTDRFASMDAMATALQHAAPAAPVRPLGRASTGRHPAPVTRRYGPRPPATRRSSVRLRRSYALVLVAIPVLLVALAWSRAGVSTTPAAAVVPATGEVVVTVDGVEHRYRVGQPGDVVLLGDWACTGSHTIGLYRPGTGRVLEFGAAGGVPIATAQLAPDALPVIEHGPDGCDTIATE